MIGAGIYIYLYVCGPKKNLNRTLAIDLPFQTFVVGLLVKFIGYLPLLSPEMLSSSSKSRIFLYNAHLALFLWKDDTITVAQTHW